jgi:cysteinyl-tRNA synthetase
MSLQVYNTMSKQKEPFVPLESGKVRLYVCGVTVYDLCHIGHARSQIVFDVIYRYLRHSGYDVTYVRNFTDIDDKIIRRANETQTDFRDIANRFIPQMIELIQTLLEKDVAYQSGTDVYFRVERFPDYGKLSGRTLDDMMAGARVQVDEHKHNPLDFVLWKGSKPGEPSWDSPWGPGRPGWHIECSAMGKRFLGETFDIHGGGKDLIFPHHENEIAQSEAATGAPFVHYWLHNGFVNINNEKMSKSLGNFFTIRDILKTTHPETLRLFVLSKHYRSPVDFSEEALLEAERGLERFYNTLGTVESRAAADPKQTVSDQALAALDSELFEKTSGLAELFTAAMDNDFNTAQAIGYLFDLQRSLQRFLDKLGQKKLKGAGAHLACRAGHALVFHAGVLGLLAREPEQFMLELRHLRLGQTGMTEAEVEAEIQRRQNARSRKDFAQADAIRQELLLKGIVLEDSPQGTRWRIKSLHDGE